jgi:hypothetical protein
MRRTRTELIPLCEEILGDFLIRDLVHLICKYDSSFYQEALNPAYIQLWGLKDISDSPTPEMELTLEFVAKHCPETVLQMATWDSVWKTPQMIKSCKKECSEPFPILISMLGSLNGVTISNWEEQCFFGRLYRTFRDKIFYSQKQDEVITKKILYETTCLSSYIKYVDSNLLWGALITSFFFPPLKELSWDIAPNFKRNEIYSHPEYTIFDLVYGQLTFNFSFYHPYFFQTLEESRQIQKFFASHYPEWYEKAETLKYLDDDDNDDTFIRMFQSWLPQTAKDQILKVREELCTLFNKSFL